MDKAMLEPGPYLQSFLRLRKDTKETAHTHKK